MPPKAITLLFTQSLSILTAAWFWNRTICPRMRLSSFCSMELTASRRALFTFGSKLHLPPGRVVWPDGRLFLVEGKGFGWYHKENQSDIVQSRDYLLKLVQRLGPKRPVIFARFSQGGVMSIVTGLHCPNKWPSPSFP